MTPNKYIVTELTQTCFKYGYKAEMEALHCIELGEMLEQENTFHIQNQVRTIVEGVEQHTFIGYNGLMEYTVFHAVKA